MTFEGKFEVLKLYKSVNKLFMSERQALPVFLNSTFALQVPFKIAAQRRQEILSHNCAT